MPEALPGNGCFTLYTLVKKRAIEGQRVKFYSQFSDIFAENQRHQVSKKYFQIFFLDLETRSTISSSVI